MTRSFPTPPHFLLLLPHFFLFVLSIISFLYPVSTWLTVIFLILPSFLPTFLPTFHFFLSTYLPTFLPYFLLFISSPLSFHFRNAVDYSRISNGDIIWRNKDPALDSRMKAYTAKGDSQVSVRFSLSLSLFIFLFVSLSLSIRLSFSLFLFFFLSL